MPALRAFQSLELDPGVTFLVGENGSGKSTLIEALAIAAGFGREGGTKNFRVDSGVTTSTLADAVRLVRGGKREKGGFFLRAESMFNIFSFATAAQLSDYGWEDLHEHSHGEAFLWVMENRFFTNGLFILDEPEAALSPQRQLTALILMKRCLARGAQFVIATHSPILMAYPGARILFLDPQAGPTPIAYDDVEHVSVTRQFLQDPARMVGRLLAEPDLDDDDGSSGWL